MVAASTSLWSLVFSKIIGRLRFRPALILLIVATSAALNWEVLRQIENRFPMSKALVTAKIRYFYGENFNQPQCARQVNICPDCVLEINKWERDRMAERLKSFRTRYPAGFGS